MIFVVLNLKCRMWCIPPFLKCQIHRNDATSTHTNAFWSVQPAIVQEDWASMWTLRSAILTIEMMLRLGPTERICLSFWIPSVKWSKVCVLVPQSCLTLCNPMECSLPGSSVHGILWARVLEGRSSRSRCWSGRFLQRTVRKNLLPASLLAPGRLQAIFAVPWLVETSPWISAFSLRCHSPCLCIPVFPCYRDTSRVGLGPTLATSF